VACVLYNQRQQGGASGDIRPEQGLLIIGDRLRQLWEQGARDNLSSRICSRCGLILRSTRHHRSEDVLLYEDRNPIGARWNLPTARIWSGDGNQPVSEALKTIDLAALIIEGAAATKISPTYCLRHSAWRSQKQNSSFFRKQPEMRVSTNSCAEPYIEDWMEHMMRM
jgi:hypothetical protein